MNETTIPTTISVMFTTTVDAIPTTCSACPFADCCDGRVASLTKRGGVEWTKRAMTGRPKACPLTIS